MRKIRILLYHRVEYLQDDYNMLAVTPENFFDHMEYLSENYDVLSLEDLGGNWFSQEGRDGVVLTFDDGCYDWMTHGAPVLKQFDFPAAMFIATGAVGTSNEMWTDNLHRAIFGGARQEDIFTLEDDFIEGSWPAGSLSDKVRLYSILRKIFQVSPLSKREEYERQLLKWAGLTLDGRENRRILDENEIRTLSKIKGITIGAHSVSHPSLRWLSLAEQKHEILESKRRLEQITGKTVDFFSYPFGTVCDFSEDTIHLLRRLGFKRAVAGYPGELLPDTDPYRLPRYTVRNYDLEAFQKFMEGTVMGREASPVLPEPQRKKIRYTGCLENDLKLRTGSEKIIIWGAGFSGRQLYRELKQRGFGTRVAAFGDSDPARWDTELEQIPVWSLEKIRRNPENKVYLVKGSYDWEICKDLAEHGVDNIHWIII